MKFRIIEHTLTTELQILADADDHRVGSFVNLVVGGCNTRDGVEKWCPSKCKTQIDAINVSGIHIYLYVICFFALFLTFLYVDCIWLLPAVN